MQYAQTLFTSSAPAASAASPELMMLTGGLSAFGTVYASMIKSQGLKNEAAFTDLQAKQAQIQGEQQANVIRQKLLETLAQNRAAAAAGGVSTNVGSAANAQIVSEGKAGLDLAINKSDTNITSMSLQQRAQSLRDQAKAALLGGFIDAGGGLLTDAYKARQRGTVPSPKRTAP
jgi:hypothetical protein